MAINSSLSATQRSSYAPPTFKAPSSWDNPSLLSRVNWVFGLNIAYLTAGVSLCFYKLYQAYRFSRHTDFGLDDHLKLALCRHHLDQTYDSTNISAKQRFQSTEKLLKSIPDNNSSKEELLTKLALLYAKESPEDSYQMALSFSSSHSILEVAESLKKNHSTFDTRKLGKLFHLAYEAKKQKDSRSIDFGFNLYEIVLMLKFAHHFHSLNDFVLRDECMSKALQLAQGEKKSLDRFKAYCEIARYFQEVGKTDEMSSSLAKAQDLLASNFSVVATIEARLYLAHTLFLLKNFSSMNKELNKVVSLIKDNNSLERATQLYRLAKLLHKIRKNENAKSTSQDSEVESLIKKALDDLKENTNSSKDRARAYLSIAKIYQEKLLPSEVELPNEFLEKAFQEIQGLPENNAKEIHSKIPLLTSLSKFCEQDNQKMLQIGKSLEQLYAQCPLEADMPLRPYGKDSVGQTVLTIYNKAQLQEQSVTFFSKYLSDLQTIQEGEETFNIISRLVRYNTGNIEQKNAQLQAAENLLPKIKPSLQIFPLSMIIKEYLEIDDKKAHELLENYKHQQAKKCLIHAIAIPTLMGLVYFQYLVAVPFLWILHKSIFD